MIRITKALAVAAVAALMLPSIASALGISIVGVSGAGADGLLLPGETVTFDLVLENNTGEEVIGADVIVSGYDPVADLLGTYDGNLRFDGGQSAAFIFNQYLDPPGVITDPGLENLFANPPYEQFIVNQFDPQARTAILFRGAGLSAEIGSGLTDIGIGGAQVQGGAGDVHFRVTFAALASGQGTRSTENVTLNFNLDAITLGGGVLPSTGDSFSLTVVPEPGTALLMGLGLVGLASRRR